MASLGGFPTAYYYVRSERQWEAVRGLGGWSQLAFEITPRLTWNMFGGLQAPSTEGLQVGAISHDYSYASNLIFRLAPNVLVSAEALQQRTGYVGQTHTIRDHYDLAIGYLF